MLSIYIIDFSVNAVQAADRALLVDVLPASEQGEVNAWAGRMTGIGSVAGFGIAEIDLTRYFGWLGGSQIQILSILVTLFFVLSHAVTCWAVTERVLLSNEGAKGKKTGVGAIVREIWTAYTRLPRPIWLLFQVQLYAWIGWFSIMFYRCARIASARRWYA